MLDFVALAQKYRISLLTSGNAHCRPGWVQCQCPFCGSRGSHEGWYLGFSKEQGCFSCYRCGSVRFWDVLDALLGGHEEARKAVNEFQMDKVRAPRPVITRQRAIKPPPGAKPMVKAHRKYLQDRGFDPEALEEEWGLLGTGPTSGPWSWRVIIPVSSAKGRVVAYQGRSIGGAQPKYKMSDDADILEDPHGLLYGLDRAKGDAVIVVEGAPGVWRLGSPAVGTFGIDWKREQANVLRKYKRRYILFDPEPKAQQRAEQLAATLSLFPGETEVLSGFTTDPGEFSERKVRRIRESLGL